MKNILITGTSSGFGKVMAEHLSAQGFQVVGTSRNPTKTNTAFPTIKLDVNDADSVKQAVAEFISLRGNIDVLVNNAGYGISGAIENTTIEEAKAQFDTNFFGVVRMTQAVLPLMRQQQNGMVLNIASMGGLIGLPFQGFYSASKFALEGFVEALRMEIHPYNIKVMNINPGDYKTSFTANRMVVQNVSETYRTQFEKTLKIYERDEENGANSKEVALLVEKLIRKKKGHKIRYLVGDFMQVFGAYVKRFVGSRVFEKIMMDTYVGGK